jgi:hypothetical protein
VAGVAVASSQFINQSIKLADVKRAINQSENSLSINQVEALKLELVDYAHFCFVARGGVCSTQADAVNESMRYCSLPLDLICEFIFAHAHHVSPERTTNASTPADLLAGRIGKLAIAWYPLASPARASTGVIRTGKGRRASNIRDRGLGLGSQIHQAFACGGRY